MFILFTIVSPVITKFTNSKINISSDLDIEKYLKTKEVSSESFQLNNKFSIKEMYMSNLKVDIKAKIESKDFIVESIDIKISDDDEYKIEKLKIKISGKKENKEKENEPNVIGIVDTVEKISVSISNKVTKEEKEYTISKKDESTLKEYISNMYDINQKEIYII